MSFLSRIFGQKSKSKGGLFRPKCSICGQPSAMIEVIPPYTLSVEWVNWEWEQRWSFIWYRKHKCYQLLYDGPGGSNGWVGDAIDVEQAERIVTAFTTPNAEAIRGTGFYDGAGFCADCGCFYCYKHWSVYDGYGTCPCGHGKSLDPHWHPPDDD